MNYKTYTKVLLLAILQVVVLYTKAQNLVPNPSFEQISNCPCQQSEFQYVVNWTIPNSNVLTPDLYATCADNYTACTIVQVPKNVFGWQIPKQGLNYVGIGTGSDYEDTREFIETKLLDTLLPGNNYCISFYVNLANSVGLAISNIGALFSDSLITNILAYPAPSYTPVFQHYPPNVENPLGNIITDTLNWTLVKGTYSPNTKKTYMVIGNMDLYSQIDTLRMPYISTSNSMWGSSYYYIDMVSVTLIKPVVARNDTTIANCDSIKLGNNYDDNATYTWWPKTGMNDSTLANPTAQPTVTTTYYVKKVQCSNTTTDSIKVTVLACNMGIKQYAGSSGQVSIYPNPASNMVQVALSNELKIQDVELKMMDMLGNTVKQSIIYNLKYVINIEDLSEGVYFINLKTTQELITKKLVVQR